MKKSAKKVSAKTANKKVNSKPGVIATIASTIQAAGKKGITKDDILKTLVKKFPDRNKDSMQVTINAQLPTRIASQGFEVGRNDQGAYFKK